MHLGSAYFQVLGNYLEHISDFHPRNRFAILSILICIKLSLLILPIGLIHAEDRQRFGGDIIVNELNAPSRIMIAKCINDIACLLQHLNRRSVARTRECGVSVFSKHVVRGFQRGLLVSCLKLSVYLLRFIHMI